MSQVNIKTSKHHYFKGKDFFLIAYYFNFSGSGISNNCYTTYNLMSRMRKKIQKCVHHLLLPNPDDVFFCISGHPFISVWKHREAGGNITDYCWKKNQMCISRCFGLYLVPSHYLLLHISRVKRIYKLLEGHNHVSQGKVPVCPCSSCTSLGV